MRNILPSIEAARYLVVVVTPEALTRGQGGGVNWVEREIEAFVAREGGSKRIVLLLGPGESLDRLPAGADTHSGRWDPLRFEGFSPLRSVWP